MHSRRTTGLISTSSKTFRPTAWNAKPPDGKGRTVAAIVAHMRNVRVMWLKASKADDIPEQLDGASVTPAQAVRGLERSREALSGLISRALANDGRIKNFRPDVTGFIGYLIAHDAIIADRSRCWHANSDTRCRRRPCSACVNGALVNHCWSAFHVG